MPRKPRERSPIGFYHVYARGTGGLVLFEDDADHHHQYDLYGIAVERHGWKVHAFSLMHTHHHVLVEAPFEDLVAGMQRLGTCQAMRINRRRDRFGHAVSGRFGSSALHAHHDVAGVAIYIAVNPVAAGIVDDPADHRWSSHRATLGLEPGPTWLETDWLPRLFAYEHHVARRTATLIAGRLAS